MLTENIIFFQKQTKRKNYVKYCLKVSLQNITSLGRCTQKNFFTTLSIIQENFNYKIKYSQDYLVNKLILYQFEVIVTILRILFHQIDIKFSSIQEKPTSTLSYGYFFSECTTKHTHTHTSSIFPENLSLIGSTALGRHPINLKEGFISS